MESDNSNCSTHSDSTIHVNDPKSPDIGRPRESLRHGPAKNTPSPTARGSPDRTRSPGDRSSPSNRNIDSPHGAPNGGCNLELLLEQHRAAVTAYTLALTKTSTNLATSIPRKPHHTIESILGLTNSHARHTNSVYSHHHHSQYRESSVITKVGTTLATLTPFYPGHTAIPHPTQAPPTPADPIKELIMSANQPPDKSHKGGPNTSRVQNHNASKTKQGKNSLLYSYDI
ncbi:hypothetical protein M8J76_010330 [Diaphorina citri]|nr:hypothetical protein M8J77_016009 [Diaphorina citri]KAI5709111.1 hypothetical protein M8J76_010330 [Diaphorina citri]